MKNERHIATLLLWHRCRPCTSATFKVAFIVVLPYRLMQTGRELCPLQPCTPRMRGFIRCIKLTNLCLCGPLFIWQRRGGVELGKREWGRDSSKGRFFWHYWRWHIRLPKGQEFVLVRGLLPIVLSPLHSPRTWLLILLENVINRVVTGLRCDLFKGDASLDGSRIEDQHCVFHAHQQNITPSIYDRREVCTARRQCRLATFPYAQSQQDWTTSKPSRVSAQPGQQSLPCVGGRCTP